MRIILESTNSEPKYSVKATIELQNDDLHIWEVIDDLVRPILIAYGFAEECVDKALSGED